MFIRIILLYGFKRVLADYSNRNTAAGSMIKFSPSGNLKVKIPVTGIFLPFNLYSGILQVKINLLFSG
jgi:hypothetical protein